MRQLLKCFVMLFFLLSCNERAKPVSKRIFSISKFSAHFNDVIYKSVLYNSDIILLSEEKKLIILDRNYQRRPHVESELNTHAFNYLFRFRDTIWLGNEKETFNLINYQLVKKQKFPSIGNMAILFPLCSWTDTKYTAFGFCNGEFGGSAFFVDNVSGKNYSCPATCPTQIIPYKNGYLVACNIDHMNHPTSLLYISDPGDLYHTPDDNTMSNWWIRDSSIYKTVTKGVNNKCDVIFDSTMANLRACFTYKSRIFAVLHTDSLLSIVELKDHKSYLQDTIALNVNEHFDYYTTDQVGDRILTTFSNTVDKESHVLVIEGAKIDYLY